MNQTTTGEGSWDAMGLEGPGATVPPAQEEPRGLPFSRFRKKMHLPANPVADKLRQWSEEALQEPIFQRSPTRLRQFQPILEFFWRYYRTELRHGERMPSKGPFLLVGNHNAITTVPELYLMAAWWLRERGLEAPVYGLAHDLVFALPLVGKLIRELGAIPASPGTAELAFQKGAGVLVFPGGDLDACRSFQDRNKVILGERKGFVRLALRQGVPIVPVVAQGAHEVVIILSAGQKLARHWGLERMRLQVIPLTLSLPWGLSLGYLPHLPLPSKVTLEVCPPLHLPYGPEAAEDEAVVDQIYRQVEEVMQETLTRLAQERPWPWFAR